MYLELGLRPSTRFVFPDNVVSVFARHRAEVCAELAASRQRFVVSDLSIVGFSDADLAEWESAGASGLPPGFPDAARRLFPWTEPIVFRSGRYSVHQVTGPVQACWPEN